MRKLHLVGLTTDLDGLIFAARKGSKSGGYVVPLESTLLDVIADAQRRRNGEASTAVGPPDKPVRNRAASALTPREMQARLRAGRSIDEVADEAGVDTEWVTRFAVPILAEQAQVVELARTVTYSKPRLGDSAQPLGGSVAWNLADRGVTLPEDVFDAAWSAYQLHDSVWMVRFRYRSRGKEQDAQWELDVPVGRLTARNRLASDLGFVEAGRRRRFEPPPVDDDDQSEPPAVSAPPRARATFRRSGPAPVSSAVDAPVPARARSRRDAAAAAGTGTGSARKPVPSRSMVTVAASAGKAPAPRPAAKKRPTASSRAATGTAAPAATRTGAKAATRTAGKRAPGRASPARPSPRATTTAKSAARTGATAAKAPARRPSKAARPADSATSRPPAGVRAAAAKVATARVAASRQSAVRVTVPKQPPARPASARRQARNATRTPAPPTSARPRARPAADGAAPPPRSRPRPAGRAAAPSPKPEPQPEPPAPQFSPRPLPDDEPDARTPPAGRRSAPAAPPIADRMRRLDAAESPVRIAARQARDADAAVPPPVTAGLKPLKEPKPGRSRRRRLRSRSD